jgi:hypothetical protein
VSAALERDAPVWGLSLDEVHLIRTDGRAGRREAGVVHHRHVLTETEVAELNGVRLVSGTRCALEVTTMGPVEPCLVTVNGLLNAGATTPAQLAAAYPGTERWPHSLTTRVVLNLADARIESAAESRLAYLFWSRGLPSPTPQYPVYEVGGRLFARLDFALPQHRTFIEVDGRQKYFEFRRAGESVEDFVLREKRREETVCRLLGWVCIRVTWADLARPDTLAQRIGNALAAQAGHQLS